MKIVSYPTLRNALLAAGLVASRRARPRPIAHAGQCGAHGAGRNGRRALRRAPHPASAGRLCHRGVRAGAGGAVYGRHARRKSAGVAAGAGRWRWCGRVARAARRWSRTL
ncbi:MAG: hypothetical protein WKG07_28220 [Hymenobacter sp.]